MISVDTVNDGGDQRRYNIRDHYDKLKDTEYFRVGASTHYIIRTQKYEKDDYMKSTNKRKLTAIDLFSGIGGFSYALRPIAHTVAYCENDDDCRRLLRKNMKDGLIDDAPIFQDIKTLHHQMVSPQIDLMTAGFPCTDVSSMNPHGKGIDGLRSGLIQHVFRLIDEIQSVQYIFLENSNFLIKRGFESIAKSFADRRFSIISSIISANESGAPHLRKRWYCVAIKDGASPLPRLHNRHLISKFNNFGIEPVPRVIPRVNDITYKETVRRGKALGNSIVPIAFVFAYNELVIIANRRREIIQKSRLLSRVTKQSKIAQGKSINIISEGKLCQISRLQVVPGTGLQPLIHLVYGHVDVKKKLWATPVALSWRQCLLLSKRSEKLLTNQVYYDKVTQEYIRAYAKSIDERFKVDDARQTSKKWVINPEWIEWLMNYPRGYTK